ncbi:MAG: cob(I)yrinic acid a,c-diamide adenosyltransferase [Candidatus Saelkia tenebricola]|nr:cob(I)yrinic acid a,c-diamide adenosyltransferase [Candidatus Saelkia tenebricola]
MKKNIKSIVTKRGDGGMTSLYKGGRLSKDDIQVEAYGVLDELCAYLGLGKSCIKSKKTKAIITSIQKDLGFICTELATKSNFLHKLNRRIGDKDIVRIDELIAGIESKKGSQQSCFFIFGENFTASVLDVARTVARRLERRLVMLTRKKIIKNKYMLIYFNRLSDLLFLLARKYEK